MQLNWQELVGRTNLKNKECVAKSLDGFGIVTLSRLDNLPGKYGQPWLCGNPTNNVVIELRGAIVQAVAEVPTIDEVIEALPEPVKSERVVIGASTPVTELKIENVSRRQLEAISGAGIETVGELFDESETLDEIPGIGEATKLRIIETVTEALESK